MTIPRSYGASSTTDIAPVAAYPTTAAHFCVWNGEPTGGKTYAISALGIMTTTSAAAAIVLGLLVNVTPAGAVTVITGSASNGPKALDGLGNSSKAVVASAVTIANNGFWHPVGQPVVCAGTATIGLGLWAPVAGIYYLPPGGLISLAGFCSAAGSAKCQLSVTWQEIQQ